MDTNQNTRTNTAEDLIVLGVASVETKGQMGITENFGAVPLDGISDA
ncbi:benenodin family lasso peptide [Stenotrophomonas sp. MMGLT7]|nr:benenodin family lasso peptide [Stenotrophomonas sp. MMGLT7]MCD7097840.1 benenodin family lasso peptide [Stenotrophomonas sp. MMGLT7]